MVILRKFFKNLCKHFFTNENSEIALEKEPFDAKKFQPDRKFVRDSFLEYGKAFTLTEAILCMFVLDKFLAEKERKEQTRKHASRASNEEIVERTFADICTEFLIAVTKANSPFEHRKVISNHIAKIFIQISDMTYSMDYVIAGMINANKGTIMLRE